MAATNCENQIAPEPTKPCEPQQLHLIAEQPGAAAAPVPVGPGVRRVTTAGGRLGGLNGEVPDPAAPAWLLEAVRNQHGQPCLILVRPPAHAPARVNGLHAPPVAVLREKDFVQFPDGFAAHVSVLLRPYLGPPPPELLGRECPVCRVKFVATAKCWQCRCGVGFHNEDRPDQLQCVQTRTNCSCGRPIILQEQFTYLPETNHE